MKGRLIKGAMVLAMLMALLIPCSVHAEDACGIAGFDDPLICGTPDSDEETELQNRVRNVLNTVYLWIGIIAVIVIVIGGVRYMTSQGEPDKIKGAKNTITYALVGLIVTLAAFAITNLVIGALEGRAPTETAEDGGGSTGGGTGEDRTAVRAVTMISSTKIVVNETARLRAKVIPDYAADKALTWTSSNPNIVSVENDGTIRAISVGTTTITVKSNNGKTATSEVTVLEEVKPESVTVSPSTVTMRKGGKSAIKATISPYNAKNKTLKWSSSNTKIATVSGVGVITAKKAGKVTITVETFNGKKATVSVAVTNSASGGGALTTGSQTGVNLNGSPNMRKATWDIINDHRMDFYYNTFDSYMSKKGGYKKYLKNLGGVFGKYADTKRIPIKTAADFQEAAEYAYGLMTIWGGDYNGHHKNAWRNNAVWKNGKTDRFRSNFGGISYGSHKESIDTKLKNKENTNYVCSTMLGAFISSTGLKYYEIEDDSNASRNQMKKFGVIRDATKLQVGDVMMWDSMSHVAIVGEVYKDYVIIYDGGSKFTTSGTYKHKLRRKSSQSEAGKGTGYAGSRWFAARPWKIDQSVTLKGIN